MHLTRAIRTPAVWCISGLLKVISGVHSPRCALHAPTREARSPSSPPRCDAHPRCDRPSWPPTRLYSTPPPYAAFGPRRQVSASLSATGWAAYPSCSALAPPTCMAAAARASRTSAATALSRSGCPHRRPAGPDSGPTQLGPEFEPADSFESASSQVIRARARAMVGGGRLSGLKLVGMVVGGLVETSSIEVRCATMGPTREPT